MKKFFSSSIILWVSISTNITASLFFWAYLSNNSLQVYINLSTLIIGLFTWISLITRIGLDEYIRRFYLSNKNPYKDLSILFIIFLMNMIVIMLLSLSNFIDIFEGHIVWGISISVFTSLYLIDDAKLMILGKYKYILFKSLILLLYRLGALFIDEEILLNDIFTYYIGSIIIPLIIVNLITLNINSVKKFIFEKFSLKIFIESLTMLKYEIKFIYENYLSGIFSTAPSGIIPLILTYNKLNNLSAYFYLLWSIIAGVIVLGNAVSNNYLSFAVRDEDKQNEDIFYKVLAFQIIIFGPLTIILAFLENFILVFLFNFPEQLSYIYSYRILLFGMLLNCLNAVYYANYRYTMQTKYILYFNIFIASTFVLSSFFVIVLQNLIWLAVTFTTCQLIVLLLNNFLKYNMN